MADQFTLSNGITVVTEHIPFFRTASAGIFVKVGSAFENAENKGISHLIEHMMFKGTGKRNDAGIADEIVRLGDDVSAFTTKEYTVYYGTTLDYKLKNMLELFSDMLLNSVFDENELEKEKQIVCEEIAMYDDSPEDIVHDRLVEAVFEKHPLGYLISGDCDTVRNIKRSDIISFLKEFYTGRNIIISLAGNLPENLSEYLEEQFGAIPEGKDNSGILTKPGYKRSVLAIDKKIDLYHINLAFPSSPADSPDQYTAAVFHSAFGVSNNSLLFRKIREELGLAYSIGSYSCTFKTTGLSLIDVTVDGKDAVKTVDEIIKIAENIKKNGFDHDQIDLCREQAVIELIMGAESVGDRMSLNARKLLAYGRLVSMEEQTGLLNAVTDEDVKEYAEKYFDISGMSACVVGKSCRRITAGIKKLCGY